MLRLSFSVNATSLLAYNTGDYTAKSLQQWPYSEEQSCTLFKSECNLEQILMLKSYQLLEV